jgi:1-deoxy-D-xylulose-5-phosphate synthase
VEYKLLTRINSPEDLKGLSIEELPLLCGEIRDYLIRTIRSVGGHFATNLGVVELTTALHYVYDTPRDRLVWDVGHQSYPHKILTGRRDRLHTIRKLGGLSGFCKPTESEYDVFGAGHASTAIAAAMGVATARDLQEENYRVIAVVGDGALTGGLAYEGLNNAGISGRNITVVLNDNKMSISPNVGAIHRYLTLITTSPTYTKTKEEILALVKKIPAVGGSVEHLARRLDEHFKTLIVPGGLFEALGFKYYGPIDGHDVALLARTLQNIKDAKGPVLLHALTVKGKGDREAEAKPVKFHGISPVPPKDAPAKPEDPAKASWSEVFGKSLAAYARERPDIVAITAAMSEGTGLDFFDAEHPEKFFDVGIAEAYAVTFAGGLAREGMRPVAAIYSTFLQRAYDQVIHDIALQHLPVIFCLDRAGLVGADGPTHHGALDLSYLRLVPGMTIAVPRDGEELHDLLDTAVRWTKGPFALRFPRGTTKVPDYARPRRHIPVGSWEELHEGEDIVLLAVGTMVETALKVREKLTQEGFSAGVANARFVKPLDEKFLDRAAERCRLVVTLEENALKGGFGEGVLHHLSDHPRRDEVRVETFGLPDRFIEHGTRDEVLELAGLAPEAVARVVLDSAAALRIRPRRARVFPETALLW